MMHISSEWIEPMKFKYVLFHKEVTWFELLALLKECD